MPFQKAVAVNLTRAEREAVARPTFCEDHFILSNYSITTIADDPTAHALLHAFAVGSQLAEAYRPPVDSQGLRVTTLPMLESHVEGLAVLSAMLTSWAGSDEKAFQKYLTVSSSCGVANGAA